MDKEFKKVLILSAPVAALAIILAILAWHRIYGTWVPFTFNGSH